MSTILANVSKKFGDVSALSPIDLAIEEGKFIAILGPSGCGKTTLLRLLAGFEAPTTGEIRMNGQQVAHPARVTPPEKRNIGMVFQSFALWPHLKVKEQIQFPLKHHRFTPAHLKKRARERVEEMLEIVGLQEYGERMPNELSGGQKQRVAIARALAPQPALLLMDEPLSSLDAELRMDLRQEIQTIHRLVKTSIVYVTHDQAEALAMADEIVVMRAGRIEQVGTPEQIYTQPATPFVATFVGKANLIKGSWYGDQFKPFGDEAVIWQSSTISPQIRKQGYFPVRPEQFALDKTGSGITGIVRNVMFQGKEFHYSVELNGELITVHTDQLQRYSPGDEVVVKLNQAVSLEKHVSLV